MTAVVGLAATASRHARLNLLWRPALLSPLVIVSPSRSLCETWHVLPVLLAPVIVRARDGEEEIEAPLRSRARDGRARPAV
eukprot:1608706-Prymnesium_polylepis.1